MRKIERRRLATRPQRRFHRHRLAVLVEPARASPAIGPFDRLGKRPCRWPLPLNPTLQPAGKIVGKPLDLQASGHHPRPRGDVDDDPLPRRAPLDRRGRFRFPESSVLEREHRLAADRREKQPAIGLGAGEDEEVVVGNEGLGEALWLEVCEPADVEGAIELERRHRLGGGATGSEHGGRKREDHDTHLRPRPETTAALGGGVHGRFPEETAHGPATRQRLGGGTGTDRKGAEGSERCP